MADLSFLDNNIVILISILILLTSIVITNLAFYRYFKYEKALSTLVTAIGFLLVTICIIVDHIDSFGLIVFVAPGILPPNILYNNNLGGLDLYILTIGLVVLLIGIVLRIIREE